MKLRFIFHNLTKIVFAIAVLNTKLTLSLSYHTRRILEHQHTNHDHHQQQHHEDNSMTRLEKFATKESENNGIFNSRHYNHHTYQHDHHHHHQHHYNDPHLMELAESAKDPKNLRNGIYHDGAVTYDLGLPNYEILNPHDPPEIITSDHPHYEEQLNHIKKTNNFTIEDFGVTPIPYGDTILENESFTTDVTTTELPETTTKTDKEYLEITTTTESPMKKYKNMKSDIEKHLTKTKEKLRILNDKMNIKNKNHKITKTNTNRETAVNIRKNNKLSKKQRPNTSIGSNSNKLKNSIHLKNTGKELQMQQPPIKIFSEVLTKDLDSINSDFESMNSFYGQSVLLPADYIRRPNYSYGFRNAISSQHHNDHNIAYSSYMPDSDLSLPIQYRLHRSPKLISSIEKNSKSIR